MRGLLQPHSSSVTGNAVQVLWEQARDTRTLMVLEDSISMEEHRKRQTSFSELLLRHLVTGRLQVHYHVVTAVMYRRKRATNA